MMRHFYFNGMAAFQPKRYPAAAAAVAIRRLASSAASTAGAVGSGTSAPTQPELKKIPSLPIVGSLIPQHSGLQIDLTDVQGFWRDLHKRYGPFYSVGFPGTGHGLNGTMYFIQDPHEMLKVLRQEGSYPSGLVQLHWPLIDWTKERNFSSAGFYGRDHEWKRLRTFLQKDILSPMSAREYLPGILRGAASASPKALQFEGNIERFLNFAAMDMFTNVLFGTGEKGMSEEEYNTFCEKGVEVLAEMIQIRTVILENVAHSIGFKTPRVKRFQKSMDIVNDIATRKLRTVLDRIQRGEVVEEEKQSYFYKAIQRQLESDVTQEEVIEMCMTLMLASVDTTASKICWNILQLGLHQEIQEKLFQELHRAVQKEGGLTPAVLLDESNVPLLHAFIRETHRCTPATPITLMKQVTAPTEIYGTTLPEGSVVGFDSTTVQLDPSIVDDPMKFDPERWLPEAVEARKGTPAAIMDHPFYSGPFSQGARMCPGARVAYLEVKAILAQLLLDYKIEGPKTTNVHWMDVRSHFAALLVPTFPEGIRFAPR